MNNPWDSIKTPDLDIRVLRANPDHNLDFFWAKDHLNRYLFVYEYPKDSDFIIREAPDLEGIDTNSTIHDEVIRLIFTLKQRDSWEIFLRICSDLISATNTIQIPEKAPVIIMNRLKSWQQFFKKTKSDILTEEKIKGLIGELLVLKNKVIPKYGVTDGLKFWIGPEGAPQDFTINDLSIEVKCQLGGSNPSVKISSVNQLYSQLPKLNLFVITLGKSTIENKGSINIPQLVNDIEKIIINDGSPGLIRFQELLLQEGYYFNEKYEDYNYLLTDERVFKVADDFPRITPENINDGIDKLTYYIKLPDCSRFEIDMNQWELNDL